ncbi:MAG: hypothetical protein ACREJP_09915, partial [Candidatus Methylomirabilales bacterium]
MAETPEEVYERVLREEQSKGSSPAVAQARAKAARMRAQKGLPTDAASAAKASGPGGNGPATPRPAPAGAAPAGAAGAAPPGESPDQVFERVLAEEQSKGSSPAVAQARAKA